MLQLHSAEGPSNRVVASFAGAYANTIFKWKDENLAVPNLAVLAGPAAFADRLDCPFDVLFVDRDLKLYLAEQIRGNLAPA